MVNQLQDTLFDCLQSGGRVNFIPLPLYNTDDIVFLFPFSTKYGITVFFIILHF